MYTFVCIFAAENRRVAFWGAERSLTFCVMVVGSDGESGVRPTVARLNAMQSAMILSVVFMLFLFIL